MGKQTTDLVINIGWSSNPILCLKFAKQPKLINVNGRLIDGSYVSNAIAGLGTCLGAQVVGNVALPIVGTSLDRQFIPGIAYARIVMALDL